MRTRTNNKPGRPASAESTRGTAERLTGELGFPVTPQAVRWWRKKGRDLSDLNSLRRAILNQERLPAGCDPKRLRADMNRPPEFGRHLREILENRRS
jgi:hypothetical protein